MGSLIKPGPIADGYTVTAQFNLEGFEPVTVKYRPITRKMWREHFKEIELLTGEKRAEATDKFVIARIESWSLDLPVAQESFDNLYPDTLATAILQHINGGTTDAVEAKLGN